MAIESTIVAKPRLFYIDPVLLQTAESILETKDSKLLILV